jgi:hypothetical protein
MSFVDEQNVLLHTDGGLSVRYEKICFVGNKNMLFLTPSVDSENGVLRIPLPPEHTISKCIQVFEERKLKQPLSRDDLKDAPFVNLGENRLVRYSDIMLVVPRDDGTDVHVGPNLTASHLSMSSMKVQQILLDFEAKYLEKRPVRVSV